VLTPRLRSRAAGSGEDRLHQLAVELVATDRWVREMWLSNGDMARLFERAVLADAEGWPDCFALVNGISANRGSVWSLDEARELLGYQPRDDVYGGTTFPMAQ